MGEIRWTLLRELDVPARPEGGLWSVAVDFVDAKAKLKLESSGSWKPSDQAAAGGPDGDLGATPPAGLFVQDAPFGALIAKHGGSTAAKDDGKIFVVGRQATYIAGADAAGALFVTINVVPGQFPQNGGSIKLQISAATDSPYKPQ